MARAVAALVCLSVAALGKATAPSLPCSGDNETCARVPRGDSGILLLQKFSALSSLGSSSNSSAKAGRSSSAEGQQEPYIWHRDPIHLRAHTGKRITVQGERVHAEWYHQGSWETFTIELKGGRDRIVRMGDIVYLRGHMGLRLTVDGDEVNAKYGDDRSPWQEFVIEPSPPPEPCDRSAPWYTWGPACHDAVRELRVGDAIFLRAHTGKRVVVQDNTVHAKWDNQGHWETLVVEKTQQDEVSGNVYSQCECCGCGDETQIEGPCPKEAGGAALVTELEACLEAYKSSSLDLGDHCPPGSHWVGTISSPWYPSGCFLTRGSAEGCEWWNIGFNTLPASETQTTCCGVDSQVCFQPAA